MLKFMIAGLGAVLFAGSALAGELSPSFGSSTQDPIQISIDPATGQPIATDGQNRPVLVTAR